MVARIVFPEGRPDVFVHGEAGETQRGAQALVRSVRLVSRRTSISPYWRREYTDEAWREVKRDWLAEIERDLPAA